MNDPVRFPPPSPPQPQPQPSHSKPKQLQINTDPIETPSRMAHSYNRQQPFNGQLPEPLPSPMAHFNKKIPLHDDPYRELFTPTERIIPGWHLTYPLRKHEIKPAVLQTPLVPSRVQEKQTEYERFNCNSHLSFIFLHSDSY